MPRCQRTFRKLPAGVALPGVGGVRWICPHCPEAETYETVQRGDLLRFAETALAVALGDFGLPNDVKRPVLLLLGLFPECVRETADKRYDLYLQAASDDLQYRLQIGHELFHRVCSQGRIFHWTHEMLACVFSVRVVQALGFNAYADTVRGDYAAQAALLSAADMQNAPLWQGASAYPPGLYGRAFVTGQALLQIAGWPALCRLARWNMDEAADALTPDVSGWISTLSPTQKREIGAVLGITNP